MSGINPAVNRNVKPPSGATGINVKPTPITPRLTPETRRPEIGRQETRIPEEEIKKSREKIGGQIQTSILDGKPAPERLAELINQAPLELSDQQFKNFPEKILGDNLYYQKITLQDLRNLKNSLNKIENSLLRHNTERTIEKYLNSDIIFGKPAEEYEIKNQELGEELREEQDKLEKEIEEKNKEFAEGVEEKALERERQFREKELPLKEYIEQLDRRSGRLDREDSIRRFILREIFPSAEEGDIKRVSSQEIEKMPDWYEKVFNSTWSLLMSMIKKDAGRLSSTAQALAKGETPQGFEAETAGIFDVEDIGLVAGMLSGLITGDERLKNQQWMGFVINKIENEIDLNEFVERYGDLETKALEGILPMVLTGEISSGVLENLIKQEAKQIGKGLSKEAGDQVIGAGAETLATKVGEFVGEEAQEITSDLIKGAAEERLEKQRQIQREREEARKRAERRFNLGFSSTM